MMPNLDGGGDKKCQPIGRLCVYNDDRNRLLDAGLWRDSVLISEWFFRGCDNENKCKPTDNQTPANVTTVYTTSTTGANLAHVIAEIHMENDETILVTNISDGDSGDK